MAKLTITEAARVAGVARSTLHRAINAGRVSVDPDGHLDTAELLRAGYTLHVATQQGDAPTLHDATPRNRSAQHPPFPAEIQALQAVQQERELLRLERDLLRQQLAAAQIREQAVVEREREAREERQAAREREALLLRMVEQTQQRYDRLLDAPRPAPAPQPRPASQAAPGRTPAPAGDARGTMRQRIVALLQDYPEGPTPAEIAGLLGVGRSLTDTCQGMLRYGLLRRIGRGRYSIG